MVDVINIWCAVVVIAVGCVVVGLVHIFWTRTGSKKKMDQAIRRSSAMDEWTRQDPLRVRGLLAFPWDRRN